MAAYQTFLIATAHGTPSIGRRITRIVPRGVLQGTAAFTLLSAHNFVETVTATALGTATLARGITRRIGRAVLTGIATISFPAGAAHYQTLAATAVMALEPITRVFRILIHAATAIVGPVALTAIPPGQTVAATAAIGASLAVRKVKVQALTATASATTAATRVAAMSQALSVDAVSVVDVLQRSTLRITLAANLVSSPTLAQVGPRRLTRQGVLERFGHVAYTLCDLTVTAPVTKTWYLAAAPITTGAGVVYLDLLREHGGASASAALAGSGSPVSFTLSIENSLGTGGPGRRFMDVFATNVPGYAEPYDLLTATLAVWLYWPDWPDAPLQVAGHLQIMPDGIQMNVAPGEPETWQLTFGPDERRYKILPRTRITKNRYPHAADSVLDAPVPVWFGRNLRVPLTSLDSDGARWLIGSSPAATPINAVSRLWTIRPTPGATSTSDRPAVLPVKLYTGGSLIFGIATDGTPLTLKAVAQRFELDTDGAFCYAVAITLRRKVGATACIGSISIAIVLDADGLPGDTLVDSTASAEITAAIVTTGVFTTYVIPLQSNKLQRPAYIPPNRGLWCVIKYAANTSAGAGEMEISINSGSVYARGSMATLDTAANAQWIISGRQQSRPPVREDYTGIGQLGRDVATGEIGTRPSVTVSGV